MPPTLAEQLAIVELRPGEYESKLPPFRMGNPLPIGFGGCALGIAINAAYATVRAPNLALYSAVGHFHGPASTERLLRCSVEATRDTRSFATRRVRVTQEQPGGGSYRTVLEFIADFHVVEPAVMEYARPPSRAWPGPEKGVPVLEAGKPLLAAGTATEKQVREHAASMGPIENFFEVRHCPDGMGAQNLSGVAKHAPTSQDDLPITERLTAEWIRCRDPLPSLGERAAALAFYMDGQLAFLPLTHGGGPERWWFEDVAAVSSLDFALRILAPDVDVSRGWHIRESRTLHAGHGRTFSEGWLWDEEGRPVAITSQQSIMRGKKPVVAKGSNL